MNTADITKTLELINAQRAAIRAAREALAAAAKLEQEIRAAARCADAEAGVECIEDYCSDMIADGDSLTTALEGVNHRALNVERETSKILAHIERCA